MESLYYNNPEIKSKIDTILKKCSLMMANLGTNTPLDVNTQENAKTIEREWLKEVKEKVTADKKTYDGKFRDKNSFRC